MMKKLAPEQEARAMDLHQKAYVLNALDSDYSILEDKYFQKLCDGQTSVSWVSVGGGDSAGNHCYRSKNAGQNTEEP